MARFYQTSSPTFVDYSEGVSKGGSGQPTAFSLLGDLDILPQDMPRYSEILTGYDSQINELARRAQADPRRSNTLQPDIMRLQQQMRNDLEAGELAAFVNRKKDVDANEKLYDKLYEKDPTVSILAKDRFRSSITPADYDPTTRTYNEIKPYAVQVWTPADTEKWRTNFNTTLKETKIGGIKEDEKLGPHQKLIVRGEVMGVTRKRALEAAVASVPRQALEAEKQRKELMNLDGAAELQFYTKDEQGNIIPNLNTVWGREIEAAAQKATREDPKVRQSQFTDQSALARLRSDLAKSRMRYGQTLRGEDEEWFTKLQKLYAGEGYTGETGEMGEKSDNALVGRKFKGGLVSHVEKVPGQKPVIVYEVVITNPRTEKKEVVQRSEVLDYDALREVLPPKTFNRLREDATSAGAWTNERIVKLPYEVDKGDALPEPTLNVDALGNPTQRKEGSIGTVGKKTGTFKSAKTPTFTVESIEEAKKAKDEDYNKALDQMFQEEEMLDLDEIIQENE
jgi:hypothetical protein